MLTKAYTWVEDNYTFQCRAKGLNTTRLVILLLFANEKKLYIGILNHILYLLFRTCCIERNANHAYSVCTIICIEMMNTVLWEHSNSLLWLHSEVQERIWHFLYAHWELVPWHCLPVQTAKVTESDCWFCSVFFCLFVNKNREMSDCLHCFLIYLRQISTYKKAWKSFIQIADCTLFSANINIYPQSKK